MTGAAVSTLLITRDSSPWLAQVIANVRPWSTEVVVVVDTASQDNTYGVASALADRVVPWEIGGYIELVLQRAVTKLCSGDWIMRLDDDELMPADFGEMLGWLCQRADTDDYAFRRLLVAEDGAHMALHPTCWPDYQIRLRTAAAYQRAPWPTEIHALPVRTRQWIINTDNTTIWHCRNLARSAAAYAQRTATAWQLQPEAMTRVTGWTQSITEPVRYQELPGQPPLQLAALIAAGRC